MTVPAGLAAGLHLISFSNGERNYSEWSVRRANSRKPKVCIPFEVTSTAGRAQSERRRAPSDMTPLPWQIVSQGPRSNEPGEEQGA